ncbi:MAG: ParB/RepB/Spo0J family partition protein [Chloroflexota bacterium]
MSSRRRRGENTDDIFGTFSDDGQTDDKLTASDFADAGYDSSIGHDDPFAKLGRNREKIRLTLINSIIPNQTQPRRAIPSSVRQYWSGLPDSDSMGHFFQKWLEEVNLERGGDERFPLDDYLSGNDTPRVATIDKEDELEQFPSQKIGPKEQSLLKVVELASSIKRDGLINPISIAQNDRLWEIETGERRWLAYHLLNWHFGGNDWEKIPARQVDTINIWRQSNENNVRADLNAIAKARQFALLLMDILSEQHNFQSYNPNDHEQNFYAQVADGNQYRVPRSRGEELLNAMGLENPVQLRQHRALLRLPQAVWEWADDLNWTESFIRKEIIAKASDEEDQIRLGVKHALADGYTVSSVTVYEHLLENENGTSASGKSKFTFADLESSTFMKLEKQLAKLGKSDKKKAITYLEDLLSQLKSN